MRILIPSLLFFAVLPAQAVDIITANVSIVGNAANGDTLEFNADVRTWTNAVSSSSHIAIGGDIGATTTNLFNAISSSGFTGTTLLPLNATNLVSIRSFPGVALSGSISGTWGTISYVTNTVTSLTVARFPLASVGATERLAVADGIINGITSYATAQAVAGSTPFTNFVSTTGAQEIGGVKTFLDNIIMASGKSIASSYLDGCSITNSVFQMDDGPSGHLEFWNSGTLSSKIGETNGYPGLFDSSRAVLNVSSPPQGMILNRASAQNILGSLTLNNSWTGTNTFSRITNSVIVNSTMTAGTYSGTVSALTNGVYTTPSLNTPAITNSVTRGMFLPNVDDATLANAPASNLLPIETSTFVRLTAGPTGAFNLTGLDGGTSGETLIVYNTTGQNITIQHENGAVSAANRITTMTGADVTSTGNAVAMFIYDAVASRWILFNFQD